MTNMFLFPCDMTRLTNPYCLSDDRSPEPVVGLFYSHHPITGITIMFAEAGNQHLVRRIPVERIPGTDDFLELPQLLPPTSSGFSSSPSSSARYGIGSLNE